MTGYVPENKDFIREITVYDIPSTWSQLDTLNHFKAWGQDGVWTAPFRGLPTDLEKVIGKPFSLDEFTGDWMRYFTKQRRRNSQKVNQESSSKVRTTKTNTQSSKKQKVAKEIKNIDKALGGIDKLTILAKIRSMLRKLGAS
ncbi:hypothetical protein RhiirA4_476576 [Rhizophagus irregularis]|uniref:Uncharacterized protein n=1 Tax=Rhizophagus irregularis TaxID=588596 RepID=A0A2I1HBR9_9GLOM|nr:hypothetical protein RhiirA4_476576 [Rhizophagus irregularis]